MSLDLATILAATGARVVSLPVAGSAADPAPPPNLDVADLETRVTDVAVDSRRVSPGALFVAMPGERVDGHDYVGSALVSGAVAALVTHEPRLPPERWEGNRYMLVVEDTVAALQGLASAWRSRHPTRVVGITGSIGKTTTKEILAQVLSSRGPVLKSSANLNTEIGLPLVLMDLRADHWAAVLEMGMYAPGDIALLASIARPEIGIVTNVAPIHLERMGSIERIARAKSELVAALEPDGLAILNGDDVWTRAMAETSGVAPVVLIGLRADCDVRAVDVRSEGLDGLTFTVAADGRQIPFRTSIPGPHTIHSLLSAVAAGRHMGMTWDELQDAVAAARLDERQKIIRREGSLIIDDSYNAAPMSVRAALDLLREAPGTKVAVLGDMLELGPLEEDAHREVGRWAADAADWLVARGSRSDWIADEATRSGMSPDNVRRVPGNVEAAQTVREIMKKEIGDGPVAILVKGSRGMRMEEVVEELTAEGTR